MWIAEDQKRKLQTSLEEGMPIKTILRSIRSDLDTDFFQISLINRKDLENIIDKYDIGKSYRLDQDDGKSVDEFVQKDQGKSVSLYKPVGSLSEKYPDMEAGDFGLAIMNEQQRSVLMKAMASPTAILCSDATHSTNAYDIKLITLMVINSFGNGVPVAFFYCNKEDQVVLGYLFSEIKAVLGNLEPKVFMTDDAAAYWNAFEATMDCPKTKRLLCIWHVDKNWRKKLKEVVKGADNTVRQF